MNMKLFFSIVLCFFFSNNFAYARHYDLLEQSSLDYDVPEVLICKFTAFAGGELRSEVMEFYKFEFFFSNEKNIHQNIVNVRHDVFLSNFPAFQADFTDVDSWAHEDAGYWNYYHPKKADAEYRTKGWISLSTVPSASALSISEFGYDSFIIDLDTMNSYKFGISPDISHIEPKAIGGFSNFRGNCRELKE